MYGRYGVIDCHSHIGMGRTKKQTVDELLETMDCLGVELSILCPVDEHIAVSNVEGNNEVINTVKKHPDRFIGMAVANPWWGSRAAEELKRALGEGLRGLKINSSLQGHWVNDEMLDPLIEMVHLHKGHVYVHSGTPDYSLPFEVCELASRHPDVNFIMGHSGLVDVFWNQAVASAKRPGLKNVYYDTSHICFVGDIKKAVEELGADRFVFGSDSPVGSLKLELFKLKNIGIDEKSLSLILGENMAGILNL